MDKKRFCEFVLLTEDEYKKLCDLFGDKKVNLYIEKLNDYIGSFGKERKYKSHYYTIRTRMRKEGVKLVPKIVEVVETKTDKPPLTEEQKIKIKEQMMKFKSTFGKIPDLSDIKE